MAIKIITDSTSELDKNIQKKYGIEVIPLHIIFGEKEYVDGVDISKKEFFEKLEKSSELPKTNQINEYQFVEAFDKYKQDTLLVILISSELSGTYNSALQAKKATNNDIHIIDSRNVSFGLGAIVIETAKFIASSGENDIDKIINHINMLIEKARVVAVVDTLRYLKAGGRLSSFGALLGGIFNIKPIIEVVGGKVISTGKARGTKNAFVIMKQKYDQRNKDYSIYLSSANSQQKIEELMNFDTELKDTKKECILEIGCTVGVHSGPGAVGVIYFDK